MKRKIVFFVLAVMLVLAAMAAEVRYDTSLSVSAKNTLQTLVDKVDAYTTYIGKARSGSSRALACWQIMRMYNQDGAAVTAMQFYDGDAQYNAIWDARAAGDYK